MWWQYYRQLWEARLDRLAEYLKRLQAETAAKGDPK